MLGLTGPAVTLQLKQLETELGIALFDRTPDGLRPTVAGKAALDCAHAVLERMRILENDIEQIKDVRKGSLRLGVVSTAKYFAPRLIAVFKNHYPDITIELFVGNRHETIGALANHAIDIALMGRPPKEISVRAMVFGDQPRKRSHASISSYASRDRERVRRLRSFFPIFPKKWKPWGPRWAPTRQSSRP